MNDEQLKDAASAAAWAAADAASAARAAAYAANAAANGDIEIKEQIKIILQHL